MTKLEIEKLGRPLYSLTVGEYIELNRQIFAEAQQQRPLSKSSQEQDEILSIEQASKLINLAKPTIYGLTCKCEIPYIKKGKKLYFIRSELVAWLNDGRQKTVKEIKAEASNYS
jgi:excisionase family DNA binding protein